MFAAGVSKITGTEMGYLSAHDIRSSFEEVAVISTNESSHKVKKGFYRMNRMENSDTLIVGGWLDIHIYSYENKAFDKIIYLPGVHESNRYSRRPHIQHPTVRPHPLHVLRRLHCQSY